LPPIPHKDLLALKENKQDYNQVIFVLPYFYPLHSVHKANIRKKAKAVKVGYFFDHRFGRKNLFY